MAFRAALTKRFQKELKKQTKNVKNKVYESMGEILSNPFSGGRLKGELEGLWRWRIGEYRIIYMIDNSRNLVVFLEIGPRRAIYE